MYIASHLTKDQHRQLYTVVRAILDEERSVSHWTYNVLRGLFIDKVYKRLYLKEQPRYVIIVILGKCDHDMVQHLYNHIANEI